MLTAHFSLEKFVSAQFPSTLQSFKAKLSSLHTQLRDAMVAQLVVVQGKFGILISAPYVAHQALMGRSASERDKNAAERDRNTLKTKLERMASKIDGTCMPKTREDILRRIRDWVCGSNLNADEQSNRRNILWLKGNAGAGKTALSEVARTYKFAAETIDQPVGLGTPGIPGAHSSAARSHFPPRAAAS